MATSEMTRNEPTVQALPATRWGRLSETLHLPTLLVLALGLVVWGLMSDRYGAYLFPPPGRVLSGLIEIVSSGQLWLHVGASLWRIGFGFGLAVAVSVLAGFLGARLRVARLVLRDLTAVLNSMSVFVWLVLALIWFGLSNTGPMFTDTQFVQAMAPPDVANLLTRGEVEAALIWEPTTTLVTRSGAARIIATQQQVWEQTFGVGATEVHVMYAARSEIAQQYPALLRNLNAAQAEVAELWKKGDTKAVEAMMKVTRLPEEVVREALGRTAPLSGLTEQSIEIILQQIWFSREHGSILQSDIWIDDPDMARREMFVQVG